MKPAADATKKIPLGIPLEHQEIIDAVKVEAEASNIPAVPQPRTPKPIPVIQASQALDETAAPPAPDNITSLAPRKARGPKPAPVRRVSVDLPLYLIEQIRSKSFHADKTKRRVILEALNAGGLTVKDIDLEERPTDA